MFKFLQRLGTDPKKELLRALGDYQLPSFPGAVLKILEAIRSADATAGGVAEAVAADPGISVRLLRMVNSAGFAARNRVESVQQAVALLGLSAVESVVLSIGVKNALPNEPAAGFEPPRYWKASARRALAARSLAERLHPARKAESFTAGLLQDMAVPLLAKQQAKKYGPLLEHWHDSDDDLAALERKEFGWDHPQVATWICNEWKLPEAMAAAIGAHHGGVEGLEEIPAVSLVSSLREREDRLGVEALVETAHSRHGLAKDEAAGILKQAEDQTDAFVQAFA